MVHKGRKKSKRKEKPGRASSGEMRIFAKLQCNERGRGGMKDGKEMLWAGEPGDRLRRFRPPAPVSLTFSPAPGRRWPAPALSHTYATAP